MLRQATLCILVIGNPCSQVILGLKKIGFGQGKYTGFGGKVEEGETVIVAAQRELKEETGILVPVKNLQFAGLLTFIFPNHPDWDQEVHVFRIVDWSGKPIETDEMIPECFDIHMLPFSRMWDDSRYWLPPMLAGLKYSARFLFKEDNETVDQVVFEKPYSPTNERISETIFSLKPLLFSTLSARSNLLLSDPEHQTAIRLFNGFLEGFPELVVDLYAETLVLQTHTENPIQTDTYICEAIEFYLHKLPWINTVIVKKRTSSKKGLKEIANKIVFGNKPTERIKEHGVWYAVNLLLHQDNTFYIDTRNLRRWAIDNLYHKRVLNTFAHTGSLGVAAKVGGAKQVIHIDRNRKFLDLAKRSYASNALNIGSDKFLTNDFFPAISSLKRRGELFDCVFLDPPFFSVTDKGRVDQASQSTQLINKVRPIIADGGWLIAVNNALYLSGADYLGMLETLCKDGYLRIESIISIPPDCACYPETSMRILPSDPKPFNHATKIVILRVRRKET